MIRSFPKVLLVAAVLMCGMSLFAQDSERISMLKFQAKELLLPFAMVKYETNGNGLKVTPSTDNRKITIRAEGEGTVSLTVYGAAGESKAYIVTIDEDLERIFKRLKDVLKSLPELDITKTQDKILIEGTISSISSWDVYQKILPHYNSVVLNLAKFEPTPEVFEKFVKALEKVGFKVTKKAPEEKTPNELYVSYEDNIVYVTGYVLRPDEIKTIENVIDSQRWLSRVSDKASESEAMVRGTKVNCNIQVLPKMISVDVVFVGITDEQGAQIGNKDAGKDLLSFKIGSWLNSNKNHGHGTSWDSGNNALLDLSIGGTVDFFARNGITRFRTAGHVTFPSNTGGSNVFNEGGTAYIPVSGNDNGDLKEINYGLRLEVKGGMISPNEVTLDVKLSANLEPDSSSGFLTQAKHEYSGTVVCELDKTIILGGMNDIVEGSSNQGVVGLRKAPILRWLAGYEQNPQNKRRLIILLCPRMAGKGISEAEINTPVWEETAPVALEAEQPLVERDTKPRKARKWYFLWLF